MFKFQYSGTGQTLRGRALNHLLVATGLFLLCLLPTYAQTQIRWRCNLGSGLWDDPGNWDLNRLPGLGDNVIINCSGTGATVVTLRTSVTVNSLSNNETIQWLDGSLSVANGFTNAKLLSLPWCISDPIFRGTLVNMPAGSIVENMPCALDINSTTTVLDNRGVYEVQEGGIAGAGTFNNRNILRKSGAGTGWLWDIRALNNTGRIEVRGGTLNIFGGTSNGNGTYAVASGSNLVYGYHTFTGTHSGAINGSLRFQLGTLAAGPGGATLNFTGAGFQWLGGIINGGASGLTNAGLMTIAASSCRGGQALRGTLANTGSIVQNTRDVELGTPCTLDIGADALNNRGTYDLRAGGITGDGTFNNTGTLRKSDPESTSEISATLNNTGTVEMVGGTLTISGLITQLSDTTLTGGTWKAVDDTVLDIVYDSDITTNNANLLLVGANYSFPKINNLVTNNGTLSLDAATFNAVDTFTNTGSVRFTRGGSFVVGGTDTDYIQTGGATVLDDGSVLQASRNVLIQGGRLGGNGIGVVMAQMVSNAGEINNGNSVSLLLIQGNYVQTSAGKLQIKIGGTRDRDFDQLLIDGAADLDGTLNIRLINGFTPRLGDRFTIMQYGMHTREFPTVTGFDLGGGLILRPQYDDNTLTLVVAQAM